MKVAFLLGAALAAASLLSTAQTASAQSDRTLGINCTYAGHEHCGENGRLFGARRYGLWHHHYRRHHVRY